MGFTAAKRPKKKCDGGHERERESLCRDESNLC